MLVELACFRSLYADRNEKCHLYVICMEHFASFNGKLVACAAD